MARVDDYKNAADMARKNLVTRDSEVLAGFAGADIQREQDGVHLSLGFLGARIRISWPDLVPVKEEDRAELPIQQQVLLLHYLEGVWGSSGASLTGEWIAFQDVPDGRFYLDAFQRRAKLPLVQAFGERPGLMAELAREAYGAESIDFGDTSVSVPVLPRIRIALVLWAGDEEFPPEGNLLFDRNILSVFSAEDIAWVSGMVVYPLMGMASARTKK
ncbi:MAG: DUF3786 domain-containing protein [Desulfobacteraceae bacterium]|jgi:hypothetical protein